MRAKHRKKNNPGVVKIGVRGNVNVALLQLMKKIESTNEKKTNITFLHVSIPFLTRELGGLGFVICLLGFLRLRKIICRLGRPVEDKKSRHASHR